MSTGSVMERIFGAFKPQQVPQNMPPQVHNTGQPPVQNNMSTPPNNVPAQSPQTDANGLVPQDGATPPKEPASPVAKFDTLWEPVKTDPSQQTPDNSGFDPQKMMEAAGKVDFTKVLSQEVLQKIAAGGNDAIAALSEALNKTAQQSFGQAAIVAHKLSEQQSQKVRDELTAQIPDMVKRQSVNQGLIRDNPAFSSPAVAPVVQALQDQLAQKYPKATADELQTMAKEYLIGVSGMINPPKQTDKSASNSKNPADNVDWNAYLAEDTSS